MYLILYIRYYLCWILFFKMQNLYTYALTSGVHILNWIFAKGPFVPETFRISTNNALIMINHHYCMMSIFSVSMPFTIIVTWLDKTEARWTMSCIIHFMTFLLITALFRNTLITFLLFFSLFCDIYCYNLNIIIILFAMYTLITLTLYYLTCISCTYAHTFTYEVWESYTRIVTF